MKVRSNTTKSLVRPTRGGHCGRGVVGVMFWVLHAWGGNCCTCRVVGIAGVGLRARRAWRSWQGKHGVVPWCGRRGVVWQALQAQCDSRCACGRSGVVDIAGVVWLVLWALHGRHCRCCMVSVAGVGLRARQAWRSWPDGRDMAGIAGAAW